MIFLNLWTKCTLVLCIVYWCDFFYFFIYEQNAHQFCAIFMIHQDSRDKLKRRSIILSYHFFSFCTYLPNYLHNAMWFLTVEICFIIANYSKCRFSLVIISYIIIIFPKVYSISWKFSRTITLYFELLTNCKYKTSCRGFGSYLFSLRSGFPTSAGWGGI